MNHEVFEQGNQSCLINYTIIINAPLFQQKAWGGGIFKPLIPTRFFLNCMTKLPTNVYICTTEIYKWNVTLKTRKLFMQII